jgi:hypothetical protein
MACAHSPISRLIWSYDLGFGAWQHVIDWYRIKIEEDRCIELELRVLVRVRGRNGICLTENI